MAETPKHLKLEGVPIVTLYVGPEKAVYHVHQNLLCDASTVFKAAFSGRFQEASERTMDLPEDDSGSVERMLQWIYWNKIEFTTPFTKAKSQECFMQLAMLNTLADIYDIYLLKNCIIDKLFEISKNPSIVDPPQMPVITYVYQNTTAGSPFRKVLVAWYAWKIDFAWYEDENARADLAKAAHGFAVDLAFAFGTKIKYPDRVDPLTLSSSIYHQRAPNKSDESSS